MKTEFSILTFGTLAFFLVLTMFQSVNAGEVRESWHNYGGGGGWNGDGCNCGGWNGGGWNGGHHGGGGHHNRRDQG